MSDGCITRQRHNLKWRAVAVGMILIVRLNAVGQVESDGTIIIVNANHEEVVIASDSRVSGPHSYSDKDCKISAFGDKVIFAASGRIGLRNDPTSEFWDAHAIAKQQFQRLSGKGTPDASPLELAKAWGTAIKEEIEKRIRRSSDVLSGIGNEPIVGAIFASFDRAGDPIVVGQGVTYKFGNNGKIRIILMRPHVLTWPKDFPWALGKNDILKKLYAGNSFETDQWTRQIVAAVGANPDPLVARAVEEVRLTIKKLPPTRVDAKGVPFSEVGYPISAIRLTNKGAEWIEKGNCPQE
jgi:hypothetical protein